ncbi:MAG TPA: glycosyl hydrolase family 18 protein, partial [Verrucomicrobiae bacterium]|nr:glycosyl hydrolase family 18 protein [Verrucomicrobiae bacterium]
DATIISYAKNNNKKIIPLISNEFNGTLLSGIINNPSLAQTHINNIVNKVVSLGYTGIDIDYENVLATDKAAYSTFIQNLASALHSNGKILTVTVQPKTSSSVSWNGPGGMDYAAIGQAADKVRIMAYDYHWNTSSAGSIAPATWVDQVVAYAVSVIPANKVVLGVPDYGYDWVGSQGKGVTYEQAINTANTYGASITNDAQYGPHYTYSVNGISHEVWFENATSVSTLLDIVNKYNINGIAIWRLGGEDANIYSAIRTKFTVQTTDTTTGTGTTSGSTSTGTTSTSGTTSTADTTSSTSGTSSTGGTTTSSGTTDTTGSSTTSTNTGTSTLAVDLTVQAYKSSMTINAAVTGTTKVSRVEFYVDGKLIATDYSAAYVAYYKAKRTNTYHTVTVVAYDSLGNKATKQKSVLY